MYARLRGFRRSSDGFTLLELVVALAIIGILLVAAIPLYLGARTRAYKNEAGDALLEMKTMEWSYYQQYATFGSTTAQIGFGAPNSNFWAYSIPGATATNVTLLATGTNPPLTAASQVSVILSNDGSAVMGSTF